MILSEIKNFLLIGTIALLVSAPVSADITFSDDFNRANTAWASEYHASPVYNASDAGNGWLEANWGNSDGGGGVFSPDSHIINNVLEMHRTGWGSNGFSDMRHSLPSSTTMQVDLALTWNDAYSRIDVWAIDQFYNTILLRISRTSESNLILQMDSSRYTAPDNGWDAEYDLGDVPGWATFMLYTDGLERHGLKVDANGSTLFQQDLDGVFGYFTEVAMQAGWVGWGAYGIVYADNFMATNDAIPNPLPSSYTLSGTVVLGDYTGDNTAVPVTVTIDGDDNTVNLDADGNFSVADVAPGTYDIRIKAGHWLADKTMGVDISADTSIGTVTLLNGDINGDGTIGGTDLFQLRSNWGKSTAEASNVNADLNGDGTIGGSDLFIMRKNWGKSDE